MNEFDKKLASLTAEQSRALAEAINAKYNERLAEYEQTDDEEKPDHENSKSE